MLCRATENTASIKINGCFHTYYQSTVLVTAQNNSGVTIDAAEIPVQQFIGGGIEQHSFINDEEYKYEVIFDDESNVRIRKSDNISQVRIWAK